MEERFNLEPVDNLDARLDKTKKWAEKRGWIFIIVTEKELGII